MNQSPLTQSTNQTNNLPMQQLSERWLAFQSNLQHPQLQNADLPFLQPNLPVGLTLFPFSKADFDPRYLAIEIEGASQMQAPIFQSNEELSQPRKISKLPSVTAPSVKNQPKKQAGKPISPTNVEPPPVWISHKRKCWCPREHPCKYCFDHRSVFARLGCGPTKIERDLSFIVVAVTASIELVC